MGLQLILDLAQCLEDSLEDADLWYSECDTDILYTNVSNSHQSIKASKHGLEMY